MPLVDISLLNSNIDVGFSHKQTTIKVLKIIHFLNLDWYANVWHVIVVSIGRHSNGGLWYRCRWLVTLKFYLANCSFVRRILFVSFLLKTKPEKAFLVLEYKGFDKQSPLFNEINHDRMLHVYFKSFNYFLFFQIVQSILILIIWKCLLIIHLCWELESLFKWQQKWVLLLIGEKKTVVVLKKGLNMLIFIILLLLLLDIWR